VRSEVKKIDLATAVSLVRREILEAVAAADDEQLRFPVGEITLTFQVGITTSAKTEGKAKLWVLELGAEGGYSRETVQTVAVTLQPPVDAEGRPVKVADRAPQRPN
jgi:hypothetical protein